MIDKVFLEAKITINGDDRIAYSCLGLAKTLLAKTIELRDLKEVSILTQEYRSGGLRIIVKTVKGVANYITIDVPTIPVKKEQEEVEFVPSFNGLFFLCGNPDDYINEDGSRIKLVYDRTYQKYEVKRNPDNTIVLDFTESDVDITSPIEFPPISNVVSDAGVDRFSDSFSKTWENMTLTAYEQEVSGTFPTIYIWSLAAKFNNNQVIMPEITAMRGTRLNKTPYCFDVWSDVDVDGVETFYCCYADNAVLNVLRYNKASNTFENYLSVNINVPASYLEMFLIGCGVNRVLGFARGEHTNSGINVGVWVRTIEGDLSYNIVIAADGTQTANKVEVEEGAEIKYALWNHINNKPFILYEISGGEVPPDEEDYRLTMLYRHRWTVGVWFQCIWDLGGAALLESILEEAGTDWTMTGAEEGECIGWCCSPPVRCTCPGKAIYLFDCTWGGFDFVYPSYQYWFPGSSTDEFNTTHYFFDKYLPDYQKNFGELIALESNSGEMLFDLGREKSGGHYGRLMANCIPSDIGISELYSKLYRKDEASFKAVMDLSGEHYEIGFLITDSDTSTQIGSVRNPDGTRSVVLSPGSIIKNLEYYRDGDQRAISAKPFDLNIRCILLRYEDIDKPIICYTKDSDDSGWLFFSSENELNTPIEIINHRLKRACFIGVK